jgi:hypothetical protein
MHAVQDPGAGRTSSAASLDAIGWGVLFVVVGVVLLAPGLPPESWLVAAGAAIILVSVVRAVRGFPVEWFTVVVGAMALVAGGAAILGIEGAAGPLALVAAGGAVIGLAFLQSDRVATADPVGSGR